VTCKRVWGIRHPEPHPSERVAVMNELFPRSLERASHILTDASYIRQEIIGQVGVRPERITSVPLGAREIFRPRGEVECEPVLSERNLRYRQFILCVGTLEPRDRKSTRL